VEDAVFKSLFEKEWITYAKRPFGHTEQILNYIGRYSHKIAIANHRLLEVNDKSIKFSYKNYRKEGAKEDISLPTQEFIRRFAASHPLAVHSLEGLLDLHSSRSFVHPSQICAYPTLWYFVVIEIRNGR